MHGQPKPKPQTLIAVKQYSTVVKYDIVATGGIRVVGCRVSGLGVNLVTMGLGLKASVSLVLGCRVQAVCPKGLRFRASGLKHRP